MTNRKTKEKKFSKPLLVAILIPLISACLPTIINWLLPSLPAFEISLYTNPIAMEVFVGLRNIHPDDKSIEAIRIEIITDREFIPASCKVYHMRSLIFDTCEKFSRLNNIILFSSDKKLKPLNPGEILTLNIQSSVTSGKDILHNVCVSAKDVDMQCYTNKEQKQWSELIRKYIWYLPIIGNIIFVFFLLWFSKIWADYQKHKRMYPRRFVEKRSGTNAPLNG